MTLIPKMARRLFFQNSVLPQHMCASNKFNLAPHPTPPPEDKSPLLLLLSLVSVWRERPNNSVFLSSSWKSSCSMFVLCKAAINGSRRTAKGFRRCSRPCSRFLRVVAKHEGGGGRRSGGADLSEMGFGCMSKTPPPPTTTPPKASLPHVNSYFGPLCRCSKLTGCCFSEQTVR